MSNEHNEGVRDSSTRNELRKRRLLDALLVLLLIFVVVVVISSCLKLV